MTTRIEHDDIVVETDDPQVVKDVLNIMYEGEDEPRSTGPIRFVASSSLEGAFYKVDIVNGTCTCPDYVHRGRMCKHQVAAATRYF